MFPAVRCDLREPEEFVGAGKRAAGVERCGSAEVGVGVGGVGEFEVDLREELQRVDERLPDLWYLGGWTLFLAGERQEARKREAWEAARGWLTKCVKVYREEGWEDEGIWEHAQELLKKIRGVVKGEEPEEGESEAEEDAMSEEDWESEDDEDAVMA